MSDTLTNALAQAGRSSSVLSGIANPAVVNPLAGYGSAISAVQGIQGLQEKAALQAAGDAFRASIDPNTGMPNQTQFLKNLAADPRTGMVALDASGKGQALDNNTFVTQMNRSSAVVGAVAGLIGQYPNGVPQEAINAEIDRIGPATGLTPQQIAQAKAQYSDNPQANTQAIIRTGISHLNAAQQLTATQPHFDVSNQPQGAVATATAPITSRTPGQMTTPGGGVKAGVAPGDMQDYNFQPVDANGKPSGAPYKVTAPKNTIWPDMQGTQISAVPATGGPPTAPIVPSSGAYKPPAPPANTVTRPSATTPPPVTTPQATTQPPVTTPPITTPPVTTPPAVSKPPAGAVATAAPMGTEETLKNDIDASKTANTAMPDQQKRLIAGQSALDALKLADTGPSTGFVARANAFLKAQGVTTVPQGQLSDTDYRQLLQKNLLRFAQNNGQSAGTDLGLKTKLESNANADEMLAGANRHVLIQDLGILKRDIAQTQEMPSASVNGDVVKHIGSYSANTAPEAFMWNSYSPDERAAIEKEYADKGQTQKLHTSLEKAVRLGAIPDPRKAPPTPPPAPATTGMAAPNQLIPPTNYATATPNALAA